ncbi:hypothetical protein P885DRAFT_68005 [Corynascus similis CBS 632.67]
MTGQKRAHPDAADNERPNENDNGDRDDPQSTPTTAASLPLTKRRRLSSAQTTLTSASCLTRAHCDRLSPLSDELLLRILSFLTPQHLVAVAPVSRRFYRLASDSQLWKALYYARFILPRAMRIPGFRRDAVAGSAGCGSGHRLHYTGRNTLPGRPGARVSASRPGRFCRVEVEEGQEKEAEEPPSVDWKRQFKIRYNWSRGKCAVEELKLGREGPRTLGEEGRKKMLVKIAEGVAVTADRVEGLRAWNLKNRRLVAQIAIGDDNGSHATPSCITVDESEARRGLLDVALGFSDGSFGIWRLSTKSNRLKRRYRHEKSSNGELMAVAFSYPYLLTATEAVLVSLYTFEAPNTSGREEIQEMTASREDAEKLRAPYLLTSLDSHTSRPPLALSIRRAGMATIASVAYTFSTRRGWAIGLQDLHIQHPTADVECIPEITATRIAYTPPVEMEGLSYSPLSPPATPQRGRRVLAEWEPSIVSSETESKSPEPGPTTLCYTHPYLLATLPDNTLVLHMCTSNASSLSISDGIRLWGHTSGISDAEITARGKAVSVSTRGEEMRVWELEGRSTGVNNRSVEIRPWHSPGSGGPACAHSADGNLETADLARDWDERRNWVGFDDEMVIVLKETKGARESLMVYDFT